MTTPYRFIVALLFLAFASRADARPHRAPLEFYGSTEALGAHPSLTAKESSRIERFLTAVFPAHVMKRLEHTREDPNVRRATYAVVDQDGERFVIAGYTARWGYTMPNEPALNPVNVFAVYRMENGTPNQVWRSKAWEANYSRLGIQTANVGKRNVVLFEEGGAAGEFGLASVFTFSNAKNGVAINDLTPSLPWLLARTHFPLRPLYGVAISLKLQDAKNLVLSASDQSYQVGLVNATQLERTWKYVPRRNRFEHALERRTKPSQMTQIGEGHIGD